MLGGRASGRVMQPGPDASGTVHLNTQSFRYSNQARRTLQGFRRVVGTRTPRITGAFEVTQTHRGGGGGVWTCMSVLDSWM